jgi:hypothetical protein
MTNSLHHQERKSLIMRARHDLAGRLDIEPDQVDVVEAREVVWRDGSLGCPQPGRLYTQALVPGLCIRLGAEEKIYHYHSGGTRPPFLCDNPRECEASGSGPGHVA